MAPKKRGPRGPAKRGSGSGGRRDRDYMSLGRSHPATGSHLPMEDTTPPYAVVPDFAATRRDRALQAVLLCQAPSEGD